MKYVNRNVFFFLLVLIAGTIHSYQLIKAVDINVSDPDAASHFVSNDSKHYYAIARQFSSGDFSMKYITEKRAHRQPLYPAALAVPLRILGENLFFLALINIIVMNVFILSVYFSIRKLFNSNTAGFLTVLFVISNNFLFRNISTRLLTEPLFVLLSFSVCAALLFYIRKGDSIYLYGASLFAGLSYLSRPNGLFLMLSLSAALFCFEMYKIVKTKRYQSLPWQKISVKYAVFILVFAVTTIPSWMPRTLYHGNPIYHEYLPNYLWADSYKEAHVSGPPRYTIHDYLADHSPKDMVERLGYGFREVYIDTLDLDKKPVYRFVVIATLFLVFFLRKEPYIFLTLFMFIQLLPIVWTMLSNPTPRIPYASLLPFVTLYFAFFISVILEYGKRIFAKRVPRFAET